MVFATVYTRFIFRIETSHRSRENFDSHKKKYDAFHLGKHANSLRSADGESIQQKDSAVDDHQGASGDGITLIVPAQKVQLVMPLVNDHSTCSDEQDAAEQ